MLKFCDKGGRIASWVVGAGTVEIKLLRAFYKMRSFVVNMVVKSFGKKKGER